MKNWHFGKRDYGYGFIDATEYFHTPFLSFAVNRITGPDELDPHDHPSTFISFVVGGGYTERLWDVPGRPSEYRDIKRGRFSIHRMKNTACHNILAIHGKEAKTFFFRLKSHRDGPRFWVDGKPVHIYKYMAEKGLGKPTKGDRVVIE